jgi:hypothetical protein
MNTDSDSNSVHETRQTDRQTDRQKDGRTDTRRRKKLTTHDNVSFLSTTKIDLAKTHIHSKRVGGQKSSPCVCIYIYVCVCVCACGSFLSTTKTDLVRTYSPSQWVGGRKSAPCARYVYVNMYVCMHACTYVCMGRRSKIHSLHMNACVYMYMSGTLVRYQYGCMYMRY